MKQIKQTIFLCLLWMIGIGVHAEEIPNNEIWYTSKNEQIVKYETDRFGARIVSNTYSNGKGVMKFDNSVTSIGDDAFSDCSGLTSITIPNSVISIGYYAFCGCYGLTSITIPNSVTSIGDDSFAGCSGLTSINIPNSVTSIGEGAFRDCYFSSFVNNSSLDAESNNYWGAKICNNDGLVIEDNIIVDCAKWVTSINIPNSVTSIGSYAFYECSGLTSIDIPNSVTSIGNYAFEYCSGLTSITIPNSVTSIRNYAFEYCSGLTSITIPNSVTSIGEGAFRDCYFSSFVNNSSLDAESNNYWGAKICNNDGLVIEDNIIVDCAKWVTSINIPNSVTSIGRYAFSGCIGLTSIDIPNSVTSIGERTFEYCSGLTSINIPNSVKSIGYYAFYGCSGLTSITIPNSVTSIENYAFEYCSGLTSITIPNSVTSIGSYAFYGCSGLTSITIPNSVTSIGESAFAGCSGLTSITIPNSVTSIGYYAFYGCSGLTSITIPNSVTSIGNYAFYDCTGLISIKVSWSRPISIPTKTFEYIDKTNCILYVPKGTSTMYMVAPGWIDFVNIQEYDVTDIKSTPSNSDIKVYASSNTITITGVSANEPVSVYDTNGVRVAFGTGNGNIQVTGNGVYFVKTEGLTFKVCM